MRPAELAYLDVAKARAERYRLAWISARERARRLDADMGALLDENERLMEFAHDTETERDEARAEVVRLGRENTRLIEEVRTLREQPIRQGPERGPGGY